MFCLLFSAPPYASATEPAVCGLEYILPNQIGPQISSEITDADFAQFSWRTFLALNAPAPGGQISVDGDNSPQWSAWSSTADLINQRDPGPSGSRYYPPICRLIPGYKNHRVLQQVGKVDDSFLEASTGALSADPLLDRNGNFLRFEIMLSPALYDQAVKEGLYERKRLNARTENVNLACGETAYSGGDPANPLAGAMVLKAAWMEAGDFTEEEKTDYHIDPVLVFTPGYRNAIGIPTCELQDMALVGLHVARKLKQQPNWTWATWEHVDNAPDCTEQMPNGKGGPINQACPTSPIKNYNFFSESCQDESEEGACQTCNVAPEKNSVANASCINPFEKGNCSDDTSISCTTDRNCRSKNAGTCLNDGWCLDRPPASISGKSRLCRQVPVESGICSEDPSLLCTDNADCSALNAGVCEENYPTTSAWNTACWSVIDAAGSGTSAWKNYRLISTQWVSQHFSVCENVQDVILKPSGTIDYSIIEPAVYLRGDGTKPNVERPVLANTSMESYERSNCTGCHAKTGLQGVCSNDSNRACTLDFDCLAGGSCTQVTTDFMYWLKLEVGDPPAILSPGRHFSFKQSVKNPATNNRLRMKFEDRVAFVPERLGADDPRCNLDPTGTVKARIRFFNNTENVDSYRIDLPCEHWKKASRGGYRYRSNDGACNRVDIKLGKRVSATCRDVEALARFVSEGESLSSVLTLNRIRYCAVFDDFIEKGGSRKTRLRTRTGSIPNQCPIPIGIIGLAEEHLKAASN